MFLTFGSLDGDGGMQSVAAQPNGRAARPSPPCDFGLLAVVPAPPDRASKPTAPAHALFLLALVALHAWAGWGSNGTYDTYRDLFFAHRIATGSELPLSGPPIFSTIHLSPLWYYVHAAAFYLTGNPASVAVLTALLAGLRFPLAYILGRKLVDARFGLLFAIALAMPGWSAFPLVTLTTPSMVESACLLTGLCAASYARGPSAGRAAMLGLSAGLALNAHPTTALLVGIGCTASFLVARRSGGRPAQLLVVLAAAVAPFVPCLIDQLRHGFPDVVALGQYPARRSGAVVVERLLPLLDATALRGFEYVQRYWHGAEGIRLTLAMAGHGIALAISLLGILMVLCTRSFHRGAVVAAASLLVVQTLFVAWLRPETPFWMLYAHLPLVAFLVALGLYRVAQGGPVGCATVVAISVFWIGGFVASLTYVARGDSALWVEVSRPGAHGLMDVIQHPTGRRRVEVVRIPFAELDDVGRLPCTPLVVHGHQAQLLDRSFGFAIVRRCGSTDHIQLGGVAANGEAGGVGLLRRVWRKLALEPADFSGPIGVMPVKDVWTRDVALRIVDPRIYPPRLPRQGDERFLVRGRADASDVVVVSHLADEYFSFRFLGARANGIPVVPVHADTTTAVLQCDGCPRDGSQVEWEIDVFGGRDLVDVVTFASR